MSEIVSFENMSMSDLVKTLLTDDGFMVEEITDLVENKSMWEIIDILDYLNANINTSWFEELFEMIVAYFLSTHSWVDTILDFIIKNNTLNNMMINDKKWVITKLEELNTQLSLNWWNPIEGVNTLCVIKNSVTDIQWIVQWLESIDNTWAEFSKDLDWLKKEVMILMETISKKISQWIDLWNYWS